MKGKAKPSKIDNMLNRLPVGDRVKDAVFGLVVGLGASLIVLGIVAFVTRDMRPTQYIFRLLQSFFGM